MHHVIEFVGLFFAGMLAGMEFVVRFGVRGPLAALDDRTHIQLRQELIRTLRVIVPAAAMPAFAAGIAVTVLDGTGAGFAFRLVGVAAQLVWFLSTMFGTVPINEAAFEWDVDAPPSGWQALVDKWERLNTLRTVMALVAFAAFLAAAAVQLSWR